MGKGSRRSCNSVKTHAQQAEVSPEHQETRGPSNFWQIFLGWSRPVVQLVLDYLCQIYPPSVNGNLWDLSRLAIVLPTSWAVRRLLAQLAETARSHGVILLPPDVITVGQLPERLYSCDKPLANEPTCLLAWCIALRELAYRDESALRRLFPHWTTSTESQRWLSLAQSLAQLRYELSGGGFSFHDVLQIALQQDPEFPDRGRWETLDLLERLYLETLDREGLCDVVAARFEARARYLCHLDRETLLVGLVDLPPIVRQLLGQVRDQVKVLTVAPRDFADRFDELGCLIPEYWQELPGPVPEDRITLCQQPADQAYAVVRFLSRLDERHGIEDITVGAPDESLVPLIVDALEHYGLPARYGPGRPLIRTSVWALLEALGDFLEQKTAEAFGSLLRHPVAERWLSRHIGGKIDLLTEYDTWCAERIPLLMDEADMQGEKNAVKEAWLSLWQRFSPDTWTHVQPISECAERLRDILLEFYGPMLAAAGQPGGNSEAKEETLEVCRTIVETLGEWMQVPQRVQSSLEWQTTPGELLRWVAYHLANSRVPAPLKGPAVEIMGWLDVPWDDAPVTVLTSVNEGFIPSIARNEMFLTAELREWLQLEGSARRIARDAYLLSLITSSREEFHLIVGRQDTDENPLFPSRFLFSCDDDGLVRRVSSLFGVIEEPPRRPPRWRKHFTSREALAPPAPVVPVSISEMRVTQFRDYLACPYRFYLRHVLQLGTLSDDVEELDSLSFGSLAHRVLCQFARSQCRDSTAADEIAEFLIRALDHMIRKTLAHTPRPSVPLQLEQLRERLRAFANFQARHAREWEILHSEYTPSKKVTLVVDGEAVTLVGRIDRIDRRRDGSEFLIIDYKISEDPTPPEKTHRRRQEGVLKWVDLQLPLYRHLAQSVIKQKPLKLGYIVLPKDIQQTGFYEASWSEEELAEADATAEEVIRKIRQGIFWPPNEDAEGQFPDLFPILP